MARGKTSDDPARDVLREGSEEAVKIPDVLPVLPLRDAVVFPYIILPLSVSRAKNVAAVDRALADHRMLLLTAQRDPAIEDPSADDLFPVGTAGIIMRMLKLPDGRIRILVQGLARARIDNLSQTEPYLQAKIERLEEISREGDSPAEELATQALVRSVKESLDRAAGLGKNISPEVLVISANLEEPGRLADLAASNLDLKAGEAQQILETLDPVGRLQKVSDLLLREVQVLTMQHEISSQARGEMDRTQREYYLRQQLKAIQTELGEGEELAEEIAQYRAAAETKGLPEEAREELERQIRRLERSQPDSAETAVIRTYLEWLTGLPWQTYSDDNLDLDHAQTVLDEDHYDLERIKERIIEYLAVARLKGETRGPILCFVGPPGVGKTSLGRSIARAIGRRFVRLSLGGVRDEAEIRGHRRTYVGALPGRIVQGINQAGTSNPVFMLDEIDKLGADYRGDPSSALLEVLDPEQNSSFRDHYLGIEYDLSRVLFIATANLLEPIQPAFRDRMEVLRLSGYTEEEKLQIARRHLIPKQLEAHGITGSDVRFTDAGLRKMIVDYTKEAGLRNLERELAAVCRKVAVRVARQPQQPQQPQQPKQPKGERLRVTVGRDKVEEMLGPARHFSEELLDRDRVGVATGLAWTAAGGDILLIEAVAVPGRAKLFLTGQLGEVMRESAQAALSYARAWSAANGGGSKTTGNGQRGKAGRGDQSEQAGNSQAGAPAPGFFAEHDIHIHVPAGSVPKDGPSAGITIAVAILSLVTGRPVDRRLAMTGEITLRGDVLPIGGVKEKVLAARTAGVNRVVMPKLNGRDLDEVPDPLKASITFHLVEHIEEVLEIALRDRQDDTRPRRRRSTGKRRKPRASGAP